MVISITPKLFNINNSNNNLKAYQSNPNNISGTKLNSLAKDSVSFSGRAKVEDFIVAQAEAEIPRLTRIATTYFDVLESVAFKLKDKGFSFDRAYCEMSPIKAPDKQASKIKRSGTFKVPDKIRATLYCTNPYDLDSLNALLAEMKIRGYVLDKAETSIKDLLKRGYKPTDKEAKNLDLKKKIPDLDIRLEDVSDQVTKLPNELKYSIGKPQKSGYEDWQMRFVRDFDTKQTPVCHELIVLFGPEYSKAKHFESKYIYGNLRRFGELHADLSDQTIGSNAQKATRYINLIEQMFRGKISEKLFMNAKNKDLYDINDVAPIAFSKDDTKVFEGYFSGLRDRIKSVYQIARKETTDEATKRQLLKDQRSDRNLIENIQQNLRESIKFFTTDYKKANVD